MKKFLVKTKLYLDICVVVEADDETDAFAKIDSHLERLDFVYDEKEKDKKDNFSKPRVLDRRIVREKTDPHKDQAKELYHVLTKAGMC